LQTFSELRGTGSTRIDRDDLINAYVMGFRWDFVQYLRGEAKGKGRESTFRNLFPKFRYPRIVKSSPVTQTLPRPWTKSKTRDDNKIWKVPFQISPSASGVYNGRIVRVYVQILNHDHVSGTYNPRKINPSSRFPYPIDQKISLNLQSRDRGVKTYLGTPPPEIGSEERVR